MYIGDVVAANARRYPRKRAVKDEHFDLTFVQLHERVSRLANAIRDGLGLAQGDRLSVLSENRVEYLEASSASAMAGAVFTPLNHRLATPEMSTILDDSEPKVLLYSGAFEEQALALAEGRDLELVALDAGLKGVVYEDLLAQASTRVPDVNIDGNDVRGICYTGGTTGLPKGVMLTHAGVMAFGHTQQISERLRPDDRHLLIFPLGLLAGHLVPAWYWYQGASIITLPQFDPELVLRTIENERITTVLLAPTMINALVNHPDASKFDVSSLRHILYGSSPISIDVLAPAMKLFNCDFIQAYGQTESTAFVLILPPEDHRPEQPEDRRRHLLSTAGREVTNAWVRVVDLDDKPVPVGQVGELVVRSPQVMQGYWRNSEATAEALRGGWLHTGDMARADEDGYYEIVDRKKDMIISGGYNVYPKEIEAILYQHPAVREVAVIGVPDDHWGESVHAVVEPFEGAIVSEPELIEFCKSRIASYKKPRTVEFVAALPLTAAGKIAKAELRSRHWSGKSRSVH